MPDNPYIRTVKLTVTELVPDRANLPRCVAVIWDGSQCKNVAKFDQNGYEICGTHLGKRDLMFMPAKLRDRKEAKG